MKLHFENTYNNRAKMLCMVTCKGDLPKSLDHLGPFFIHRKGGQYGLSIVKGYGDFNDWFNFD